jgi:hypothetical protein
MAQPYLNQMSPNRVHIGSTCVVIVVRGDNLGDCLMLPATPITAQTTFIDSGTLVMLVPKVDGPARDVTFHAHNQITGDISNRLNLEIVA